MNVKTNRASIKNNNFIMLTAAVSWTVAHILRYLIIRSLVIKYHILLAVKVGTGFFFYVKSDFLIQI